MELIYCGRSKRRLDKKSLISLIREKGISEQEFYAWLDISVDDFAALNRNLRYETFKSQIDDYLQTGRLQPNEIKEVYASNARRRRFGYQPPPPRGAFHDR